MTLEPGDVPRESVEINGLRLTATPSRHHSGRNPRHNNSTLGATWVVTGPAHTILFGGDAGYIADLKKIDNERGPFDLTLIKVGAYDPTWKWIHMNPEDAVRAHGDLRGRVGIPVHWATFNLGFHSWREPADRTAPRQKQAGSALAMPKPAQRLEIGGTLPPIEPWWQ